MRVAVIGAGIVGVTTAYELARDGHEVAVFERRTSVASEGSFANAGVVAPGYVAPWAAPGMPAKVLRHLFGRHAAVRFAGWPDAALARWLWRWWRECAPARYAVNRARLHRLAAYSRERLDALTDELGLDYERARGYLVLLRTPRDVERAQPGLALLREVGARHECLDAAGCRRVEPGLNGDTPLAGGIHLPDDGVGNCRQFAHAVKQVAQRRGVQWHFGCEVLAVTPGARPQLTLRRVAPQDGVAAPPHALDVDAVVLCSALGTLPLLRPHGARLPMAPVYGYSITAPLRDLDAQALGAPRAALMDETFKVAISRLGQRVRVAGGAELGGSLEQLRPQPFATLHKVLDDWFPGAAQTAQAQRWKGARPMMPDGAPLLGASGLPGVWLNAGHGSSGWALACGSARVVADLIAGRECAIDTDGLGLARYRAAARAAVAAAAQPAA
ncbi:D-amino acid dehydrogenase [Azohydromonas sediminis]|uniref:D-amino acid dehydrogenase n=1 Tax=Azohydromonas sediminis TaxID=2259674 RepID=UPI000E65B2D6|nr:D-amino acid dehydrogenase [Azohydromonas sediminis]